MKRRPWTAAEDALIRERYPELSAAEVADLIKRSVKAVYTRANELGVYKQPEWIAERARRRILDPNHGGRANHFQTGHVTWNKGIPYDAGGRSKETRFRPGSRQGRALALWQPIGALRINADGYLQRKVNDDKPFHKRWRAEHIIVWEAKHGPLPKGHAIVFKDGNRFNITDDNLECIDRRELMSRNTVHRHGPEVAALSQLRGALKRQINKRTNHKPEEIQP